MPTLLRHDHGGVALAVVYVDALGVRHQKEVHHGALAPVVESEVEGQHALVVLADRSAHEGEEQYPHGPLRGAEDDGSVEGEEAPAELAVGLLARDPRPGLVLVGGRALNGVLPVLPLDAEVELGGVGVVVALKIALVLLLLLLLVARDGLGGGGGVGGAELVLVEAHDAAEGDGVRGGDGRAGLGEVVDLRPQG